MAIQVQLRRGTATQNNAFTGAIGELSFDTTAKQVRIHDGSTAGGFKIGVGDFPTGANNVALGNTALDSLDGSSPGGSNTAIGHDALTANTTASNSVAVGKDALKANTTAASNTAVGHSALAASNGTLNTAFGKDAGSLITSGTKNTILGSFDGNQGDLDIRTSDSHIVLSDGDGNPRLIIDDSGNVDIGGQTTELKLKNTTHEDTSGGRESKITFQGEQSGGEVSTLAEIRASHSGTSDDQKGLLEFKTNDGSDGTSPTTGLIIDSDGNAGIGIAPTNASDHHSLALSGNAGTGAGFIEFNDTSGNADAAIFADNGVLTLHADYDNATASSKMVFRVDGSTHRAQIDTSGVTVDPSSAGGMFGVFNTSSSGDGHILLKRNATNEYQIGSDTSDKFFIYNYNNSAYSLTIDNAGRFRVQGVYNGTTSSGANVVVQSDGKMERSTSSLRYKNTVNDAAHGLTELLTLRPVTFKGNNDGDTVFGGLIAEEVHDAGLTEFVQYDNENRPDALAYGNMVSLCIKSIQELSAKNDALEARITALENA